MKSECFKVEAPEMAKKKNLCLVCQVTLSSSQICREVNRDDYLFWMNAQYIFFQLPKLNKCCLGVELASAHQVIKMLKMDHLSVYRLYPTPCRNGYRM